MRLVRFRHGDRIATGAVDTGSDAIRILKGTFFEDPIPTGEEVPIDDVRLLAATTLKHGDHVRVGDQLLRIAR